MRKKKFENICFKNKEFFLKLRFKNVMKDNWKWISMIIYFKILTCLMVECVVEKEIRKRGVMEECFLYC